VELSDSADGWTAIFGRLFPGVIHISPEGSETALWGEKRTRDQGLTVFQRSGLFCPYPQGWNCLGARDPGPKLQQRRPRLWGATGARQH